MSIRQALPILVQLISRAEIELGEANPARNRSCFNFRESRESATLGYMLDCYEHIRGLIIMDKTQFFEDLQAKFNKAIENSPAKDIEKNVKAMLGQGFAKLDLVTREEFDIQAQVLAKTRAKLEALEARVAELEARQKTS